MQINESELTTTRGKVVGIGRIKIPKMSDFNYEIPLLSFVVIKKEDGSFISTCIHLQIDGYGDNGKEARIDMVNNAWYFLKENFNNEKCKESCWANMYDLSKANERSSTLWDKYHAVQFMLAEKGITTDRYSQLEKKIKELHDKVHKLEKKIKKMDNNERIKSLSGIMPFTIVKYDEPLKDAA